MKLYLVQHGEAEPKEKNSDRPLTQAGGAAVEHIAKFLKKDAVRVAQILHSGKLRAQQTAEIFAREIMPKPKTETTDGLAPNDDVVIFASRLNDWNEDMLIAGHLPFMSKLVSLLTTGNAETTVATYTPGSVVCLERTEGGRWAICWMLRPELFE